MLLFGKPRVDASCCISSNLSGFLLREDQLEWRISQAARCGLVVRIGHNVPIIT